MSLAAAVGIATIATLALGAALLVGTRHAARAERSWMLELARALLLSRLSHLPAEHAARYREEYEADLDQLHGDPRAALIHALHAAAATSRLTAMFNEAPAQRHDQLGRRMLAHVGFPVRLNDPHADADASYIFGGAMRLPR